MGIFHHDHNEWVALYARARRRHFFASLAPPADKAGSDDGALTDTAALEAQASVTDDATLTESATVTVAATDDGTLTDSSVATATADVSDVSSLTDAAAVAATATATDDGTLGEAATAQEQGADLSASDSGSLTEVAALEGQGAVTDSGSLDEVAAEEAADSATDAGTLSESATVAVTGADSGSLTEVSELGVSGLESGALTDLAAIEASLSVSDSWTLTDTGSVPPLLGGSLPDRHPRPTSAPISKTTADNGTLSTYINGLSGGQVVELGGGTYTERVTITTDFADFVLIRPADGETVTFRNGIYLNGCSKVIVQGANGTGRIVVDYQGGLENSEGCFRIVLGTDIEVSGCELRFLRQPFYCHGGTRVHLLGNYIHDWGHDGNHEHGIYWGGDLNSVTDLYIAGNLIARGLARGIQLYGAAGWSGWIVCNTIVNCGDAYDMGSNDGAFNEGDGLLFNDAADVSNMIIHGNIVIDVDDYSLAEYSSTGFPSSVQLRRNWTYGLGSFDWAANAVGTAVYYQNTHGTDPDLDSNNLYLPNSTSPVIDAGEAEWTPPFGLFDEERTSADLGARAVSSGEEATSDSATLTDTSALSTTAAASDAAALGEASSVSATVAVSDSATFTESSEPFDSAVLTEASAVVASVGSTDAGAVDDSAAVLVTIDVADAGTLTDVSSGLLEGTDAGTLTDDAVVDAELETADSLTLSELGDVNTGELVFAILIEQASIGIPTTESASLTESASVTVYVDVADAAAVTDTLELGDTPRFLADGFTFGEDASVTELDFARRVCLEISDAAVASLIISDELAPTNVVLVVTDAPVVELTLIESSCGVST